ncbi:MAG TPA: ABC transporter permease subunit [Planctomycetota bacterium]|nr:ABC transporter permease subunit [Planctomycetota bacterium]
MTRFALRRLAGTVPLLLAISLLAFGLSTLTGENYFDRYKADKRHDPATVRMLERNARLDRPFLERWLHWLRGICFDVRVGRPRRTVAGFEEPDFESRYGVERVGLAQLLATPEDSTELRRSGRLVLPAGGAGVRLAPPRDALDLAGARAFAMSVRNPGKVVRRLEATFEAGARRASFPLDVEPGPWRTWEIPARAILARLGGDRPASLFFSAPGTGEFRIDDLAVVEDRLTVRAGAPDFGRSFEYDAPVWTLLRSGLGNSFLLAACALVFTWGVAIPSGILAAVHRNRAVDRIFSLLSFLGLSVPNFFLALLALALLVAIAGGGETLLPLRGAFSEEYVSLSLAGRVLDRARHLILPTLVLSAGSIAGLQRITRGNLLEVLRENYVLAARARGCPESRVVYGHALRNALNPLVSIFGTQFANLVSGAALCEIVFGYPGVGRLMLDATISKDLYVVMGGVLAGGVLLVLGNLVADVLLRALDPRIEDGFRRG